MPAFHRSRPRPCQELHQLSREIGDQAGSGVAADDNRVMLNPGGEHLLDENFGASHAAFWRKRTKRARRQL